MTAVLEKAKEGLQAAKEATGGGSGDAGPGQVWGRRAAYAVGLLLLWAVLAAVLPKGLPPGIMVMGLVFGSLYALIALGIVLVYRANRVVNFAQAEFGSVAAILAIEFVMQWNMNYFLAIGLGFLIAAVIGALVNVGVIRRFRKAPRLILAVATIGIAQILGAISLLIPLLWEGAAARPFTTPFEMTFTVYPVIFNGNHVLALVMVVGVMVALGAFLRFTDYGVGIRAAAENSDRASLLGIPVPRLSTIVWSLAALLSAMAAILRVPLLGFASFSSVSGAGNSLLLRTLAAAVIARMESLPRTVVAAIAIGVFEQGAQWNLPRTTVVDAMLVLIILVALLVQRDFFSRAAETGISSWRAIREIRPIPMELRDLPEVKWTFRALKWGLLAFAFTFPVWASPSEEVAAGLLVIYCIVAVSLMILTGWAGHISLGQFALVGFGGATTAVLYGRHGLDFFLALPAGVIVAALVALVIGLPALRIKGPFLAVTTLAFAVTSATYFLEDRYFPWFIEDRMERPVLWNRLSLELEWQVYLFALVMLIAVVYAVRRLRESHTGRALIATRDNETNAEAVTLNTTRLKLTAFVISGGIAGLAGGLYVLHQNGLNTDSFNADVSLRLFSMVVIGGLGSLPGAILGAVYIRGVEFFLPPAWGLLASGAGILLLLMFLPEGLGGLMYGVRDAFLRRVAKRRGIHVPSLVADKRTGQEDTPVAMGDALARLGAGGRLSGDREPVTPAATGNGNARARRLSAEEPPPEAGPDSNDDRDLTAARS